MSKAKYAVGEYLFLVNGPVRTGRADGEFQVIGLLPDAEGGEAQYRVQSKQESFERRVRASEIDAERTAEPRAAASDGRASGGGRNWVNIASIRVNK